MFCFSISNEWTEFPFVKRIDPNYQVTEHSHHSRYQEAAVGEFGGHLLTIRHPDWGCVAYM